MPSIPRQRGFAIRVYSNDQLSMFYDSYFEILNCGFAFFDCSYL